MRGNDRVIAALNEALKSELTAINQYFVHAEMYESWGYRRLYEMIRKESIQEMKHAEVLIERILFLEGEPNMSEMLPIRIGKNVKQQMENDLAAEMEAVARYNDSIRLCTEVGDAESRRLFEQLLNDEEGHVDLLEAQLHQISELGLGNYLAQQVEK